MNLNNSQVKLLQALLSENRPESGFDNFDLIEAINLKVAEYHSLINKLEGLKSKLTIKEV